MEQGYNRMPAEMTRGAFHARLEKVEPNVYRAVFAGELNPTHPARGEAWPDAHLGDTPEGVKAWVENMARQLGYSRVVWEP